MTDDERTDAYEAFDHFAVTSHVRSADVCLVGEFDIATIARLDAAVDPLLTAGCRTLTVDLTAVTFMDATGLGSLVRLSNHLATLGGVMHLVLGDNQPRRLLRITGLEEAFGLVPTMSSQRPRDKAIADSF